MLASCGLHKADLLGCRGSYQGKPLAGAITNIDYSAAQSLRDLLDDLVHQKVNIIFARVRPSLHSDMDRHRVTAISETRIFETLHEALAAVRGTAPETPVDP